MTVPEGRTDFKVKCSVCATTFAVESRPQIRMEEVPAGEPSKQLFNLVKEKEELDLFLAELLKSRPAEGKEQEKTVQPLPETILPKIDPPQAAERDGGLPLHELPISESIRPVETVGDSIAAAPPVSEAPPPVIDISLTEGAQSESIPDPPKEISSVKRKKERREERSAKAASLKKRYVFEILVLIVLAGIAIVSWLYPQAGRQAIEWASANIRGVSQLFESNTEKKADPLEKIQITGLKQRFVNNSQVGKIRVIEGFVSNRSEAPITKVKLMARLYDSRSTLLAAKVISCGAVLDDQALENLSEQEIITALGEREDRPERIEPKGNIPFMFVFVNEPEDITQAFVVPLSVE